MILAGHDLQVFTDLQLEAYAQARERKRLAILQGGHYNLYLHLFEPTDAAPMEWLGVHL